MNVTAQQVIENPATSENRYDYIYASHRQRFANWIIDNFLLRLVISFTTVPIFINFVNIQSHGWEFTVTDAFGDSAFSEFTIYYIIASLHYLVYYILCEKLCRGYTLGKLISGTRAIRQDGRELNVMDVVRRSLVRIIPFEVFSGLNSLPWHDSWTKTIVVETR